MNNTNSYEERQSVFDLGEQLFEQWALQNNYIFHRIGFHSKNNSVPNFFRLNTVLRNIPDYILNKDNKTYVVNVKGTANIKLKEMLMLDKFVNAYSNDNAPLIYAFCFKGQNPVLMRWATVEERFNEAENKTWHDGVVYRTIAV